MRVGNEQIGIAWIVCFAVLLVGTVGGFTLLGYHAATSVQPPPAPLPPERVATAVGDDPIITFILKQEGGWNPSDPSYRGVYKPTWDWFRESHASYPADVRDLEARPELVDEFYHWYIYELRSGVSEVPDWFRLMLADWWTTSMSAAIRPLQQWSGAVVDGVWGTHTEMAVVRKFGELADKDGFARWYTKQRKSFYLDHGYGEGSDLIRRTDIVLAETLKRIRGTVGPLDRTISEPDYRRHAPRPALTLEERIARLETVLEQK